MALSLTFKMTSSTGAFERETPTISLKYSLKSIPSGCIMYGLDVSFTPSILSIAKFDRQSEYLCLPIRNQRLLYYLR